VANFAPAQTLPRHMTPLCECRDPKCRRHVPITYGRHRKLLELYGRVAIVVRGHERPRDEIVRDYITFRLVAL
jgi:hypothetical protein